MIERTILQYLNDNLDVPCYMEEPDNGALPYVVIERTGGGVDNLIQNATLAIQSYADTMEHAAELNQAMKAALFGAVSLPVICDIELDSDYNYTDTTKKKYRYQAVFSVYYY